MDAYTLQEKKEILRAMIGEFGERPASRHLSLARTHLEDALLRMDCELRVQGVNSASKVDEQPSDTLISPAPDSETEEDETVDLSDTPKAGSVAQALAEL